MVQQYEEAIDPITGLPMMVPINSPASPVTTTPQLISTAPPQYEEAIDPTTGLPMPVPVGTAPPIYKPPSTTPTTDISKEFSKLPPSTQRQYIAAVIRPAAFSSDTVTPQKGLGMTLPSFDKLTKTQQKQVLKQYELSKEQERKLAKLFPELIPKGTKGAAAPVAAPIAPGSPVTTAIAIFTLVTAGYYALANADLYNKISKAISDFRLKNGRNPKAGEVTVTDSAGNTSTLSQVSKFKTMPGQATKPETEPLESGVRITTPAFPLPEEKPITITKSPITGPFPPKTIKTQSPLNAPNLPKLPGTSIVQIDMPGISIATATPAASAMAVKTINWDRTLHGIQSGIHRGIEGSPDSARRILEQQTGTGTYRTRTGTEHELSKVPGTAAWEKLQSASPSAFRGIRAATIHELDEKMAELYRTGQITEADMQRYKAARARYLKQAGITNSQLTSIVGSPEYQDYRKLALGILASALPYLFTMPKQVADSRTKTELQNVAGIKTGTKAATRTSETAREAAETKTKSRVKEITQTKTATRTGTREATRTGEQTNTRLGERTTTNEMTKTAEQTQELTREMTDTLITRRPKIPGISKLSIEERRKAIKQADTKAGWVQGKLHGKPVTHVIYGTRGDYKHTTVLGPVEGVPMAKGKGQAYKSMTLTHGIPPDRPVKVEGGAVDPVVSPITGRRGVKIDFLPDKTVRHGKVIIREVHEPEKARKPKAPKFLRGKRSRGIVQDLGGDIVRTKRGRHLRLY